MDQGTMNWNLIGKLSLFGLAMGIATVFWIPSSVEPFVWLVIFAACAYVIARQCATRHSVHGLAVSIVNSVWITGSHVVLFEPYIATHQQEVAMASLGSPRLMMALTGPVIGVASGWYWGCCPCWLPGWSVRRA